MSNQTERNEGARGALVFEMENAALGARRIRYEVLAGILKEQDIGFEPVEYSRWCLGAPEIYMAAFLAKKGYSATGPEQVIERLRGETLSRLMQKDCMMDEGLEEWLNEAAAGKAAIAALTSLPQDAADSVASRLHLDKWGVRVLSSEGKGYSHPEAWLRAAKAVGRAPQVCLALTTGATFSQAALMAGFTVVAKPDEFTEFEDFSGVARVCSTLKGVSFDECRRQTNY